MTILAANKESKPPDINATARAIDHILKSVLKLEPFLNMRQQPGHLYFPLSCQPFQSLAL